MPFENQSFTEQPTQPNAQKQSSKFVIILIVLIILVGAYLAYSVYTGNQSTNTDSFEALEQREPSSQASDIEESDDSPQLQDNAISATLDLEINNTPEQSYTIAQVAENDSKSSCWTIIDGKVYDITSYVPNHPGGESKILQVCGKDGTILFSRPSAHRSSGAGNILENFKIGTLSQ
jgi:cytochrome b involved in lipid metabolism